MIDRQTAAAARRDVAVFAEVLVGQPLWDHQLEVIRSEARIRCVCSGRQAGKTRLLAMMALHKAFSAERQRVLVISAGDDAAKALLAECSALASSALLAGSVVNDDKSLITLSNGSTIRSVPASVKQIRGQSIDLLIIDEAAFVDDEIWAAARYTPLARPGSKVVQCSTPWGRRDRFFSLLYRAGLRGVAQHASFHWPSTISPMVDAELLGMWRETTTDREYRREVLAEWVDDAGSYFSADELEAATADYDFVEPGLAGGRQVVGGVDWGFARDSSALVLLAPAYEGDLGSEDGRVWPQRTFWLPYLEEGVGVPYATFVRRVVAATRGFRVTRLASETNGVGMMPTQELTRLLAGRGGQVVEVSTSADSKQDGFGKIKLLLQDGRLALPRHPRLLGQLSSLEYEERDSGTVRIAVPERAGHDDLAMALCLAAGESDTSSRAQRSSLSSPSGLRIPTTSISRPGGGYGPPGVPSFIRKRHRGMVIKPGQYRPPETG